MFGRVLELNGAKREQKRFKEAHANATDGNHFSPSTFCAHFSVNETKFLVLRNLKTFFSLVFVFVFVLGVVPFSAICSCARCLCVGRRLFVPVLLTVSSLPYKYNYDILVRK